MEINESLGQKLKQIQDMGAKMHLYEVLSFIFMILINIIQARVLFSHSKNNKLILT